MQDNTYGNSYQALEPYMLYGDRSVTERLPELQRDYTVRDLEYLQGMYPGHMKQLQEYVVRACDHLDYKNSPMYDEFPDRLMVNQVCDSICRQIEADGVMKMDDMPEMAGWTSESSGDQAMEESAEEMEEVEVYETDSLNVQEADWMMQQQMPPGRMPPQGPPPWGPPPGPPPRPQPQPPRPPMPPQGPPPWGPPPGPPPWGPPPGPPPRPQPQPPRPPRPPQGPPPWGPPPGPPPWGPPPRPPHRPGGNWLNDMIKVLLLNEMHRRRCRMGFCF